MNNKAIIMSLLLNTCIATHVHANTLDNNYFYFGSKFNTLQPNHINKKSDLSNFKNLYTNYWSHSLYGFLIGYQNNSYFGLEISYNNPFINQEKINDSLKSTKNFKDAVNYVTLVQEQEKKEEAEEEAQINQTNENASKTYANISNSNSNNSSLLSIKHNSIKKIHEKSEYTSNRNHINPYSTLNSKKHDKINIAYPQKNVEIATKISIPILNSIDIYSRLGCSVNLNKNLLTIRNSNTKYSFRDNVLPLISVGLQYKINKNFYSRIEFEKKITYYSNSKSQHLNSINFHFLWNFQDIFSNNSYHDPLALKYANQLKNLNFKKEL